MLTPHNFPKEWAIEMAGTVVTPFGWIEVDPVTLSTRI